MEVDLTEEATENPPVQKSLATKRKAEAAVADATKPKRKRTVKPKDPDIAKELRKAQLRDRQNERR